MKKRTITIDVTKLPKKEVDKIIKDILATFKMENVEKTKPIEPKWR